ncbi:MAG: hypothetical protein M1587_09005 [Thaumarchaeota archaeon]|nr:hypothetical protein [Nitrososphaerota archaeon]MCL5068899.1 hypothetical protein [Nitrososphaerota archaeon]
MNYTDYLQTIDQNLRSNKYAVFRTDSELNQYCAGKSASNSDGVSKEFINLGLDLLAVSDPLWGYRVVCTIKHSDNLTKEILSKDTSEIYSFVQDFETRTKERQQKNEAIIPVYVAKRFPKELISFVAQNEFPVLKKVITRQLLNYSAQHPVLVELETGTIASFRKRKLYMWLYWGQVYKWPEKYLRSA